eukprot:TRINITY_DN45192_c0_g1_i1.p3 TRINITY_DN45192_c0_g1~~TRINITY_DN45192_c0_g1_i1.p3  ORF type:complete len:139 (+),score=5.55 TRINITY_DN45192_c0_g1_i1:297-713(+)
MNCLQIVFFQQNKNLLLLLYFLNDFQFELKQFVVFSESLMILLFQKWKKFFFVTTFVIRIFFEQKEKNVGHCEILFLISNFDKYIDDWHHFEKITFFQKSKDIIFLKIFVGHQFCFESILYKQKSNKSLLNVLNTLTY